jgi:predicted short-subunit dehydrogenase-like oxidoreductase (DUF2520 family)
MNIGIIGAGKVGIALGHTLRRKGFSVAAVASRRRASLDTARAYIGDECLYTLDNWRVAENADVVAVTTQDREINKVAEAIFDTGVAISGKVFFHTSGAHTLEELRPLDKKGALLGSLHPLQTFPDIDAGIAVLPETYVFIEGDEGALHVLHTLASGVGREAVKIASKDKLLYHLSAVFVCNLLSALLYSGQGVMERAGIGLEPFYPIIRATLKNIEARGPLLSLTGPVVRGDTGTVEAHLKAMRGMELPEKVYKSLSLVALQMAQERGVLNPGQAAALTELLERDGKQHGTDDGSP